MLSTVYKYALKVHPSNIDSVVLSFFEPSTVTMFNLSTGLCALASLTVMLASQACTSMLTRILAWTHNSIDVAAAQEPTGTYLIQNAASGLLLNLDGGNSAAGSTSL